MLRSAVVGLVMGLALAGCAGPASLGTTTGSAGEPIAGVPVSQQIIYFSAPEGELEWRQEMLAYEPGLPPDVQVREHVDAMTEGTSTEHLVHSTSWHFDGESDELVLTWAVTPDPRPGGDTRPVLGGRVAQGSDAAHPVPSGLGDDAIATHAARHLAFLIETDRAVAEALARDRLLFDALVSYAPALAGSPVSP